MARLRLMGEATLDDLGQKFFVSRERIRQIEVGVVKKLRRVLVGV